MQDSFPPGTKLGPYEIVDSLGAGGMGAVYRARDSKLKRDVAIKVLPEEFSKDGIALARFQREAETLASLSHPNIGAIYDFMDLGESRFLVLELIEGETLADRIARGPLPLDEALPIARQIAEGLEAAHEKGVTHRDLKPANVRLMPSGVAKVLDFGLAKSQAATNELSLSRTPTFAATAPGMILGTPAYMPPEQAKGKETDRTADVWAFGCVVFEMLTGRPAFEGETISDILAEVLKSEPKWDRLPAETPASIRRLLQRCLRKDQRSRLHDIADARIEITDALSAPEPERATAAVAPAPSRLKERMAWAVLVVAALAIGLASARFMKPSATTTPEMRVDIATAPTYSAFSIAISPDGRKIAYVAESGGYSVLWLRTLDSSIGKPLPGTNNANLPFWSPDSKNIGFFADLKLKKIDIERETVQVLGNAVNARGGAWNKNDVILFSPVSPGVIYRIPAAGGKPEPVTQIDQSQAQYMLHVFPEFLPDGDHFLYYVGGSPQTQGIYVSSLSAPKPERLLEADSAASYAASGHLLFLQKGVLVAQAFDPVQLKVSGAPIPLADRLPNGQAHAALSTSLAGPVIYRTLPPPAAAKPNRAAWLDRTGKEIAQTITASGHFSLTSDDKSFLVEQVTNGNIDIWRIDVARGVRSQVTMDTAADTFPTWSPDGEHVIFTSNRKTVTYDLYVGSVNKPGGEELLLSSSENKIATDWSADGKFLLYRNVSPDTGYDLWALPLDKDGSKSGEPILVARTPGDDRDGQFSPDGKWVAYQSNESGSFQVYVQPFPGPGPKYQISTNGGAQVRWNRNGKELFYIALDAHLVSVPVHVDTTGKTFEAGTPTPLFVTALRGGEIQTTNRQQYTVSADGQRFLLRADPPTPSTVPLTLLLNWKPKQ